MRLQIPAKTFLLGEYAAIAGASAIILTTTPCFELAFAEDEKMHGIHPDSPAGQWWAHHRISSQGLSWRDPYQGIGGLGASSAQFLGAYLASCSLLHVDPNQKALLDAYYQCSWRGEGLRPSGYDVLAQSQNQCVYINHEQQIMKSYQWPFKDISFLLLHSGQKLATHYHLQNMRLPNSINQLTATVELAHQAFEQVDSEKLVEAVSCYEQQLASLGLVAPHSQEHIRNFNSQPEVLAAKGCGALGADVLLLIVPSTCLKSKAKNLADEGWTVLATNNDLYAGRALMKNKPLKTLEILP
jgi:mevalonate kinase